MFICVCVSGSSVYAGALEAWKPWAYVATVEERYNDNRDSSGTNVTEQFDTRVRMRADIKAKLGRSEVDLYYAPSLVLRGNPSEYQNESDVYQSVGLIVGFKTSKRVMMYLRQKFYSTDDPVISVSGRTFREDASFYQNRVNLGGDWHLLADRTILYIDAGHMMKRYESKDFAEVGDEDEFNITSTLKYLLRSGINVLGTASFSTTDLASGTQYAGADRSSSVVFAGGGLEKVFAVWSVRGRVGVNSTTLNNAAISSVTTPAGSFSMIYTPRDDTKLDVTLSHHARRGDISPYASQVSTAGTVAFTHSTYYRLTLSLAATYALGQYEVDTVALDSSGAVVDAGKLDGEDTLTSTTVGVSWDATRTLTIAMLYGFEDWNADGFLRESHQRNTARLSARLQF